MYMYLECSTRKTYPEPEEPDANVPDTGHRAENQIQDHASKHDVVQRKHLNIKSNRYIYM